MKLGEPITSPVTVRNDSLVIRLARPKSVTRGWSAWSMSTFDGLSLAWMFMVAAELIAATQGLGYLLTDGRETSRADIVLAAIVLLALLGKFTDTLMQRLEHRLLAWRDTFDTR